MAKVFISYSRKDRDFVRRLGDALAAHACEAWVDWKDIPLTAEWQQEIFANIEAADNFAFVISSESVVSANCKREIAHAAANNKRMVPIYHQLVPDEAIPEPVAKFQRIDFCNENHFDSKLAAVVKALDTDLAWVQAHTRLLTRAKEWERDARDGSLLLRGKDLRDAEQWVAKSAEREPNPTTLHTQYILASRQAATRLQRVIVGAVAVAFLIAVGLAIYAFRQRNIAQLEKKDADRQRELVTASEKEATRQKEVAVKNEGEAKRQERTAKEETAKAVRQATIANARELVSASLLNLRVDPDLSLLLAMHAVAATWSLDRTALPEAEDQLHRAIFSSHLRLSLNVNRGAVLSVAWNPDGRHIAVGNGDPTAQVWDADQGKVMLTLTTDQIGVDSVGWSPDGKRLVTGSGWDDTAKVWDVTTGKVLMNLSGHGGHVESVAWSPDGKHRKTVV